MTRRPQSKVPKSPLPDSFAPVARAYGIQPLYRNEAGQLCSVPETSLREILELMGVSCSAATGSDRNSLRNVHPQTSAEWETIFPDTLVLTHRSVPTEWPCSFPISPSTLPELSIRLSLTSEQGRTLHARVSKARFKILKTRKIQGRPYTRVAIAFRPKLTQGYYTLHIHARSKSQTWSQTSRLIVTPDSCYLPSAYQHGRRLWGLTLQLYGIRSSQNWGIGDFGDLTDILVWAGRDLGAAMVGVNPLHALLPHQTSPYSPSSRLFHNPLYLRIEEIPDFQESTSARRLVNGRSFQAKLSRLRRSRTVQYPQVRKLKFQALEKLYASFVKRHVLRRTKRGKAFLEFIRQQGIGLEHFACFQALHEVLSPTYSHDWQKWPERYGSPSSPTVHQWRKRHTRRVNFFRYLEWQCTLQLKNIQDTAKRIGMPIGLYQDLAVGIDPHGADAWIYQDQLITRASIGTPPELFSPKGQNWGLSPLNPAKLSQYRYEVFIQTFRSLFRFGGLVRIDHAMGLFRMFWIPHDRHPAEGAYVHYPASSLLGILALESQVAKTSLVGEDLGTITPLIRRTLERFGLFSYRLLFFEKTKGGNFLPPHRYPRQAMVSITTHDLPTLAGFWLGRDIDWKEKLNLYPDRLQPKKERIQRAKEKAALLLALRKEGLLAGKEVPDLSELRGLPPEVACAIHVYLARTPSFLLAVSLEDLLGIEETPNIPGVTAQAYPAWKMKIGGPKDCLIKWRNSPEVRSLAAAINHERGWWSRPSRKRDRSKH